MKTWYERESNIMPKEIEITDSFVFIRKEITHDSFKSETTGATFTKYFYKEVMYTIAEYNTLLKEENAKLWDTVDYLLKHTGVIQ